MLLVSTDGRGDAATLFGKEDAGYREVELAPRLHGLTADFDALLADFVDVRRAGPDARRPAPRGPGLPLLHAGDAGPPRPPPPREDSRDLQTEEVDREASRKSTSSSSTLRRPATRSPSSRSPARFSPRCRRGPSGSSRNGSTRFFPRPEGRRARRRVRARGLRGEGDRGIDRGRARKGRPHDRARRPESGRTRRKRRGFCSRRDTTMPLIEIPEIGEIRRGRKIFEGPRLGTRRGRRAGPGFFLRSSPPSKKISAAPSREGRPKRTGPRLRSAKAKNSSLPFFPGRALSTSAPGSTARS